MDGPSPHTTLPFAPSDIARADLTARFRAVRRQTEALAAPLDPEDQVVQSMPDCSPTKWHLGHTTWFFERFVLMSFLPGYRPFDPGFDHLFNSYYVSLGSRHPRPQRGLLTRPPLARVLAWRDSVTHAVTGLLDRADAGLRARIDPLIETGIHHEQQHQELLLMDVLHLFSCNPLRPAYLPADTMDSAGAMDSAATMAVASRPQAPGWIDHDGGIHAIGHDPAAGDADDFAYDNEGPRHDVLLRPFRLASRPVTNGDWLEFIAEDGYGRAEFWLSDGIAEAEAEGWTAPLYWFRPEQDGPWWTMTLRGPEPVDLDAPVVHVSQYEADAFARFRGCRLPTEAEWEVVAAQAPVIGNLLPQGALRPMPADHAATWPAQIYGDVWEWTSSAYGPYPGFKPPVGAIGEYNGKFMANQMVLRGGCCVTPGDHIRPSYRNFFYPRQRWAFAGLRLAADA
ncbi:ergothioneine biosynthesis protein EgtB [Tistrella sp. BH-R2-4]|uniref:Ergothioneine biosynthesis protein EgtB n=1 Tax=Tistrella arctica TaxID=3133430 RepID=A0ABU9YL87_9PROT